MNNSVKITIHAPEQSTKDEVIARLSLLNIDGFEETEQSLHCYYTESKEALVEETLKQMNIDYTTSTINATNWNAEWESSFNPVVVDDFCTIRADFHKGSFNTKHEIIITPKMSFGTGHHATTYLMVEQMAKLDFDNKNVADFGTGTGVLSILAEKLGSRSIWAIDYDEWSIENAKENILRNKCLAITLEKADSFNPAKKFEIILANINKNTILTNLHGLVFGLITGGRLLLSGLLKEDEKDILLSCRQNNLLHIETVERDNWISVLLTL